MIYIWGFSFLVCYGADKSSFVVSCRQRCWISSLVEATVTDLWLGGGDRARFLVWWGVVLLNLMFGGMWRCWIYCFVVCGGGVCANFDSCAAFLVVCCGFLGKFGFWQYLAVFQRIWTASSGFWWIWFCWFLTNLNGFRRFLAKGVGWYMGSLVHMLEVKLGKLKKLK